MRPTVFRDIPLGKVTTCHKFYSVDCGVYHTVIASPRKVFTTAVEQLEVIRCLCEQTPKAITD